MIKMSITTNMRDEAPTRLHPRINASGNAPSSCPIDISLVAVIVVCLVLPTAVVSLGGLSGCVPRVGRVVLCTVCVCTCACVCICVCVSLSVNVCVCVKGYMGGCRCVD